MQLYQMLYSHITSSRIWLIGCAKQKMMEKAGRFVIVHDALKDAPCWSLSLAMRP